MVLPHMLLWVYSPGASPVNTSTCITDETQLLGLLVDVRRTATQWPDDVLGWQPGDLLLTKLPQRYACSAKQSSMLAGCGHSAWHRMTYAAMHIPCASCCSVPAVQLSGVRCAATTHSHCLTRPCLFHTFLYSCTAANPLYAMSCQVWRGQRLSVPNASINSTQPTQDKCHFACASDTTCRMFQYNADTAICAR